MGIIARIFTNPDWAVAFWQAISAIVTAVSVIVLVLQVRKTDEQIRKTDEHIREAAIRSVWALLHTERQRMEADVTQIDIKRGVGESRREQLRKRIEKISGQMCDLEGQHPSVFRY